MSKESNELTIDRLKKYKGFENINDDEAMEHIRTMDIIISLAFKSFQRKIKRKV